MRNIIVTTLVILLGMQSPLSVSAGESASTEGQTLTIEEMRRSVIQRVMDTPRNEVINEDLIARAVYNVKNMNSADVVEADRMMSFDAQTASGDFFAPVFFVGGVALVIALALLVI